VLLAAQSGASLRASLLSPASLYLYRVEPSRLVGIISAEEETLLLRTLPAQEERSLRILPLAHPSSEKLARLCQNSNAGHFLNERLQLLQVFVEALADALRVDRTPALNCDARHRLEQWLGQVPAAELLDLSLPELAKMMGCTPRHLSRIFRDLVGLSLREKQTELRLIRAKELLATTQAKVLDVALDSGYQSQSLFNDLFKRRFGLSPARWREHQKEKNSRRNSRAQVLLA